MRIVLVVAALLAPSLARAEAAKIDQATPERPVYNDFLFPGGGKISLTGSTGIPFAASGEVAVGIGSRFALGAVVSGGPFAGGVVFGIYPRVDVVHVGPMRLVLESALLWYPAINGADNWLLARPMGRVEGVVGRVRIHASAGALLAKMVGVSPVDGPIAPYGGNGLPSGVQRGDVWNTWGGGVAVAFSARTSIFWEGFVLAHGFELAGQEWFRIPFDSMLGLTTTL